MQTARGLGGRRLRAAGAGRGRRPGTAPRRQTFARREVKAGRLEGELLDGGRAHYLIPYSRDQYCTHPAALLAVQTLELTAESRGNKSIPAALAPRHGSTTPVIKPRSKAVMTDSGGRGNVMPRWAEWPHAETALEFVVRRNQRSGLTLSRSTSPPELPPRQFRRAGKANGGSLDSPRRGPPPTRHRSF
ncbi:hypothetical protein SKAU_G00401240 [Synaphobranchus kaupii]|uniref:Uncharacterized protein n=1 Tax=Synaphobranchus kaupii TaxID=118154 RepID=A0A9Q1IBK7_SYNKA|nr:hypothetical protein SKAU_G00401240 [Synaphobranchus kaupii]